MTEQNSEILVKIHDDQLPKLATIYEKNASWAPYISSFIRMIGKWKKSEKFRNVINIFSPNNSWEQDGTIIAFIKFTCVDVFLFTLDDQCKNLYEGLVRTNLIDYSKRVVFYGVHEKHTPTLMKYLEIKNIKPTLTIPTYIYAISPDDGKNLVIECPPEVYIKKLEPSAAKQINNAWPHRYEGSEEYLAGFIEMNGGYGVFLKETQEMVAWVIKHAFEHLGMLQTEKKHMKKGYGSLVAKILAKEIAEEGRYALGTILVQNQVSLKMFKKLGFSNIGICSFIIVE